MKTPEPRDPAIGARLRALRLSSGRSLASVAEAVGISSSALSQIETGVMTPSVNRLIEIMKILGMPVSSIFDDSDGADVVVAEESSSEPFPGVHVGGLNLAPPTILGQGVVYRRLSPVTLGGFDLYESTYPTGASSSIDGAMLVHDGYEIGLVTNGSVVFEFSDGELELTEGESISFWATRPHRIVNASKRFPAVLIWLTIRDAKEPAPPHGGVPGLRA